MKYKLKIYSIWEYGQRVDSEGNPHQEDSIFPAYDQQKDTDRLFILCDGMGGHEAGEVASSTVCTAMSKSVFESAPDAEGDFTDAALQKAIDDAFNALDTLSMNGVSSEKKMGTTMTFLKFHNKGCTIAHMGDSRVYHIRSGKEREDTKILFKTEDHSLVNDLIKVGELTPEEAKHSKQKNIITRAMQPQMERRPKADIYHTADIKKGDYFYMCSDGMLEQMDDGNLLFNFSEATGDDENKVKILTQATSQNSDNHSAFIIHVMDVIDPLPIETVPPVSVANKPKPIMAEIGEDVPNNDHVENHQIKEEPKNEKMIEDDAKELGASENVKEKVRKSAHTMKAELPTSDHSNNKRLATYISFALILILLVLGVYIVTSKLPKGQKEEPAVTENPQPSKNVPSGKVQNNNPRPGTSSSPSRRQAPKPTRNAQPGKKPTTVTPSKPQANEQNSGSSTTHSNATPSSLGSQGPSQAAPTAIQQSSHSNSGSGDVDVVSSDAQNLMDAANHNKEQ